MAKQEWLPRDIELIIVRYVVVVPMKLSDWVDASSINKHSLSKNPVVLESKIDSDIYLNHLQNKDKNSDMVMASTVCEFDDMIARIDDMTARIDYMIMRVDDMIARIDDTMVSIDDMVAGRPTINENNDSQNWCVVSRDPTAIELLRRNPDKIDWQQLSLNPAGIGLLKDNPNKINWVNLSKNPGIFEPDYIEHKRQCHAYR